MEVEKVTQPKFLEFPELPRSTLNVRLGRTSRVANREIFMAQAIDHFVVLLLTMFFVGSGLSLFQGPIESILANAGLAFWGSILLLLFWWGLLYRAVCRGLFGDTLGCTLLRIKAQESPDSVYSWIFWTIESLHLALPALWALDFLCRSLGYRLGPNYQLELFA